VFPNGTEFFIKGISIGNWMNNEGYMWDFKDLCQSQWQVKELIKELIGPLKASSFYKNWLNNFFT